MELTRFLALRVPACSAYQIALVPDKEISRQSQRSYEVNTNSHVHRPKQTGVRSNSTIFGRPIAQKGSAIRRSGIIAKNSNGERKTLECPMKGFRHIIASISLTFVLVAQGMAVSTTMNLVIGVGGPLASSSNWKSYSAINIISEPITSRTTIPYIGFTGGVSADINNMVLDTMKRGSNR